MTKKITWHIAIENGKLGTLESMEGFTEDIESELTIIGILENLKTRHTDRLKTLYERKVK